MEQRQFDVVKTYQSAWVKDADIVLNIEGGTMDGYYVNCYTFLEEPEKDWAKMLEEAKDGPPEPTLFD